MPDLKEKKIQYLLIGLFLDAVGLLSFSIPGVGEFTDVVWAPLAAWIMTRMYKGRAGQAAGAVTLIEEALPWVDVVPTFTLMWLYTFVWQGLHKKKVLKKG